MCDPEFSLLLRVAESHAKFRSVAQEFPELVDLLTSDKHQVYYPGLRQRPDRIEDHRFVENIQEVFVYDSGHRIEALPQSSSENHPLQFPTSPVSESRCCSS